MARPLFPEHVLWLVAPNFTHPLMVSFFFLFFLFDYCRTHCQRRPVRTLASSLTPAECNPRALPPSPSFCRYGPLHSFSFLALAPASYVFAQSLYFPGAKVKFFFFFLLSTNIERFPDFFTAPPCAVATTRAGHTTITHGARR